jgi:hypothetical protein
MQLSQLEISAVPPSGRKRNNTDVQLLFLYVVLSVILIGFGPAGITRIVFLGGAGLLGFRFCSRNPPLYVSFVWWLWFLTPFVRRVINYRSGWVDSDPILAASLLATLACVSKVWRNFPHGKSRATLPFVLAGSAVAYGSIVGVFFIPLSSLLLETARWLAPILFGLFVLFEYADNKKRTALKNAFQSTFKWALLLMGVYSVVQYAILPGWDALWVTKVDNPAFGIAEPFGVRVFSTMASPVPLGVASVVGLVLLVRQRGIVPILAAMAGYASLALCCVRSAWGLWPIGMALVVFRKKLRLGHSLFVALAALLLLFLGTSFDPVRDTLQRRFETFSDLSDDGSLQARSSGYEEMLSSVLSNPFGSGLGAMVTVLHGKSELGGRDSGILEIALSLGWAGGAVYFFALGLVIWRSAKGSSYRTDFEIAASAISITIICHMPLSTFTSDLEGVMLWSFAGVSLATYLPARETYTGLFKATRRSSRKPLFCGE